MAHMILGDPMFRSLWGSGNPKVAQTTQTLIGKMKPHGSNSQKPQIPTILETPRNGNFQ